MLIKNVHKSDTIYYSKLKNINAVIFCMKSFIASNVSTVVLNKTCFLIKKYICDHTFVVTIDCECEALF